MTDLDPRTIAADLMTAAARDITITDVWAHIGQAYDIDTVQVRIDTSIAKQVTDLIAKAGIDLIWPDGSRDTELDAQRVENKRLTAELEQVRAELAALRGGFNDAVAELAERYVERDTLHAALAQAVRAVDGDTEAADR